jgi:hypothetical protein
VCGECGECAVEAKGPLGRQAAAACNSRGLLGGKRLRPRCHATDCTIVAAGAKGPGEGASKSWAAEGARHAATFEKLANCPRF